MSKKTVAGPMLRGRRRHGRHGYSRGAMRSTVLVLLGLAISAVSGSAASARGLAEFNAAVAKAYAPARVAAAYLRTGNGLPASLELESAVAAWDGSVMAFATARPAVFAQDRGFAERLNALGRDLRIGLRAALDDDTKTGRMAVDRFRSGLSDLRRRNGLYLFADCVLDLSAAMDAVWIYRRDRPDFDDRATVAALSEAVGILGATAARCDRLAGPADRAADNYRRLIGGMIDSLTPLRQSIRDGDLVRFINVIREQRSLERLIAMTFG